MQNCQGKADCAFTTIVGQSLGPVKLFAHVVGHLLIEHGLQIGEGILHGMCPPFRKQRLTVKLKQVFLDEPSNNVGIVADMDSIAESAFKAIAIQQRQEELKILLLAVVRGCRHQQKVSGQSGE